MRVIAHRGHHEVHPENSIAAFEAAVALGADGIECDIHATHDGQLVVLHDYQLDGVSVESGVVRDLTFQQLQAFSARIPLLAEVLSIACPSFELEIKTLDPRSIEKIVALTDELGVIDSVEFTSSFTSVLAFVRSLSEDVGVGVFCRARHPLLSDVVHRNLVIDECILLRATCLHLPAKEVDSDWINRCREAGLLVHAANVNDPEAAAKVKSLGVDQLSTDNCHLFLPPAEEP